MNKTLKLFLMIVSFFLLIALAIIALLFAVNGYFAKVNFYAVEGNKIKALNIDTPMTILDIDEMVIDVISVTETDENIFINLTIDNKSYNPFKIETLSFSINNLKIDGHLNNFSVLAESQTAARFEIDKKYIQHIDLNEIRNISVTYKVNFIDSCDVLHCDTIYLGSDFKCAPIDVSDGILIQSNYLCNTYYMGTRLSEYGEETATLAVYNKNDKMISYKAESFAINNFVIIHDTIDFINPNSYAIVENLGESYGLSVFEFAENIAYLELDYRVDEYWNFESDDIVERVKTVLDENITLSEMDIDGVMVLDKDNLEVVISHAKYDKTCQRHYIEILATNKSNNLVNMCFDDFYINDIECNIFDYSTLMPDTYVIFKAYTCRDLEQVYDKEALLKFHIDAFSYYPYEKLLNEDYTFETYISKPEYE